MLSVLLLAMLALSPNQPNEVVLQDVGELWPTSEEFHWLAKAVVGEVSVMGPDLRAEAGSWVIHVAYNRLAHGYFPRDLLSVVKQGFHGAHVWEDELPPLWAYAVVNDTLRRRIHLGEDPTNGSLFLIGGQDIEDCMDWSSHQGSLKRNGWVFSVHLFKAFPFDNSCPPKPAHERRR